MTNDTQWWNGLTFAFDPNAGRAQAGEILVGIGNSLDTAQNGIALNPKYKNTPYHSVTSYVLDADAPTVAGWRARLPDGLASIRRVVLEDLSFDSCFSLLLFGRRLQQDSPEPLDATLRAWCRYVNHWEEGYTREKLPLTESIAALATVLGHTYFDLEETGRDTIIEPALFAEGAAACLQLVSAALMQETLPEAIDFGRLEQASALGRARSHLEYEHEQYLLALQHGKTCQLSVPLAGSGRPMLVDALFLEERNPSGVLKVFARNDRDHTWTRRGFDVLGIHRPLEAGTGGDMTISITPESGLTLRELWLELERLEYDKWQGKRPCTHPRIIKSYENAIHSPDQPWWDDYGKYTLIAAPKRVQVNGVAEIGTKLSWHDDVLPAVWKCYSPIPKDHLLSEERVPGNKRLWYCRWQDRAPEEGKLSDKSDSPIASTTSIANCPTFRAWLKSLSSPKGMIHSPMDLPSAQSYRALSLDGGFLVLHRDGATAFDDWTSKPLEIDAITSIFRDMAHAWSDLVRFHDKKSLEEALKYHNDLLRNPKPSKLRKFEEWKDKSWTNRAEALKVGVSTLNHADPWPLNEFRARLAKIWGFDEQRQAMLEAVDRIDKVTSDIVAALRERRAKIVHATGAGLAFGIVAKEVVETFRQAWVANSYEWQLALSRPAPQEDLERIAHNLQYWDWASLAALIIGLMGGVAIYLIFGARASEH